MAEKIIDLGSRIAKPQAEEIANASFWIRRKAAEVLGNMPTDSRDEALLIVDEVKRLILLT